MKEIKIILRFVALMLALCLVGVWLAGFYFDREREEYILHGMKAGIVVSMVMVGIVYLFKEVILQGNQKKELS